MVVMIAALVSFAILATAGVGHLIRLRAFSAAIEAQRVWPVAFTLPLAGSIAALEAGIGTAGVASVALSADIQTTLLAAAGGLCGCYTLYGFLLLRKRRGVPCACSHDAAPLDRAVVARAAVLAALSLVALANAPVPASLSTREVVVTALATLAYAIGIWSLPATLRDPFESITATRTGGAS